MRNSIFSILFLLLMGAATGAFAQAPAASYPPDTIGYPPPDTSAADQAPLNKEMIVGTVESIQGQTATIRTEAGERVDVELGPMSYWRQHGYHLARGMHVRVEAWENPDGDGPIYAGGIWGPEFFIQLTDDQGFPLWANSEEDWQGWYPTSSYYNVYYTSPPLYAYGPGPWWYFGPPYYRGGFYHGRHFYGRPWGGPHWGGGHDRGWGGHGGGGSPHGGRRGH